MTNRVWAALLAGTILGGTPIIATPALAQDTNPNTNPPDTSAVPTVPQTTAPVEGAPVPSTSATGETVKRNQDIIVTGSRIPQPNLESASPVTVVTSQEVKVSGTTRTEDLINSLPQSFAAQGSNLSNGASGTATVNLRNLGPNRTLVLINGRRLQPGDFLSPYPDINFVPAVMIKRVDILTGGASSVYGADAVGGVVNFILDTNFTGFRIDGQASVFNHNNRNSDMQRINTEFGNFAPTGWSTNGGAQDIAGMFGASFDDGRGHVTAYATYRTQDPVFQSTRDYSFCGLTAQTVNPSNRFECTGSFWSAPANILQFDPTTGAFLDNFTVDPKGGPAFLEGYSLFNFNPYNYYQRPDERYTFGAFADYEISPAFKPYAEMMFMDDNSDALIAPSGAFGTIFQINCDNPMLTAEQLARVCAPGRTVVDAQGVERGLVQIFRRNVEGGGRDDEIRHTDYRIVGGMRGDVSPAISYDAYYQFGRTMRNEQYNRDFSISRTLMALDVVTDPATGQPVCRAILENNPAAAGCVPYNIFQQGGVTQAALDYLQTPGFQRGTVDETIAHVDFTITGEDYGWRLPWAESGIGLNLGAEYRKQAMDFRVDQEFATGDLAGQGGPTPPIKGQFDVRELFAEVKLPIVEHNFIDLLQIGAGYRYSNYHVAENSFNTDTYKIEAEFAPIRDVRFRGSYNRAVRAPNIVELFFPQSIGLGGTVDPCAGDFNPATATPAPSATLAQCQLTGVSAAQYGTILANPANQYNALFGGNPKLQPEKADSWTAGVVVQPRFIPGLALTADYFDIKVKNVIGVNAYGAVFQACFQGDPTSCALIHRSPGSGSLWLAQTGFVELTSQNFPGVGLATKGWDFSGVYARRLGGLGTLNVSFTGTLQGKTATLGGAGTGQYSPDSIPINKWKHKLRVGLTMPNGLGVSTQWRHFSGVNCDQVNFPAECGAPANSRISAQDYFDLAFTARLAQRLNLRIGANNILDREPPLIGGEAGIPVFASGNTYPQIYDALGRYLFAGFTVDF
ncbi:MAG: TonB-dependent receptor domain-containing protein [Sphingomicrobium sp.]